MIYLDYAADTPTSQTVLDALTNTAKQYAANPNASHVQGIQAKQRLDLATTHIANMLGTQPEEIVLTSGATEANNLAVLGVAHAYQSHGRHVITSPMEHASVTGPMSALKAEGYTLDFLKIRPNGQVDLAHLQELLRQDTILLSLCAVDSEVGVIQPLADVKALLTNYPNCQFHVDATQAVGKIKFPLHCADLFTLSPHKFGGLTGTGVLAVRNGLRLAPLWYGGIGATLYRSGTPALALTVATETALEEALEKLEDRAEYVQALNTMLLEKLALMPFVELNHPQCASPYIVNFSVIGMRGRDVIASLSQHDICVSSKSACCAPAAPSHPVLAMTGNRKRAMNTIRVSMSHHTTQHEIDQFCDVLANCALALEDTNGYQSTD